MPKNYGYEIRFTAEDDAEAITLVKKLSFTNNGVPAYEEHLIDGDNDEILDEEVWG